MSKEIKARVQQKHGTKAEWDKATSFVPLKGELIAYTDDWTILRGFDWGYSHPFSCHWYAVDHSGVLY